MTLSDSGSLRNSLESTGPGTEIRAVTTLWHVAKNQHESYDRQRRLRIPVVRHHSLAHFSGPGMRMAGLTSLIPNVLW